MPFDATPEVKIDNPVAKALMRAKEMISDPKRWCKGQEVMIRGGVPAYCAMGALVRGNFDTQVETLTDARNLLDQVATANSAYGTIVGYNDGMSTQHKDIMRAFDLAIKLSGHRKNRRHHMRWMCSNR